MKYLHIMLPNENVTYYFINALYKHLPQEEFNQHSFLMTDTVNSVIKVAPLLLKFDNCLFYPTGNSEKKRRKNIRKYVKSLLTEAELVVWHSTIPLGRMDISKLAASDAVLNKSVWVTQFMDRVKPTLKKKKGDAKKLTKNQLKFMCGVKYVNFSTPWEKNSFKRDFGAKHIASIPYPIPGEYVAEMDKLAEAPKAHPEQLGVWLGYNGRANNKHMNLLGCLKGFAENNINVFMPMNAALRGDWGVTEPYQYRDDVEAKAKGIFGAKGVTRMRLRDLPPERYFKLLNNADIGVFWDCRPHNLNTIFYLLYMGKKVYIRATAVYQAKLNQIGLPVYTLSTLEKSSFNSLLGIPEEELEEELSELLTEDSEAVEEVAETAEDSAENIEEVADITTDTQQEDTDPDEQSEEPVSELTPEELEAIALAEAEAAEAKRIRAYEWLSEIVSEEKMALRWAAFLQDAAERVDFADEHDCYVLPATEQEADEAEELQYSADENGSEAESIDQPDSEVKEEQADE